VYVTVLLKETETQMVTQPKAQSNSLSTNSLTQNANFISECGCVYVMMNLKTKHCYIGTASNARKAFRRWQAFLARPDLWRFRIVRHVDDPVERQQLNASFLRKAREEIPPELLLNARGGSGGKFQNTRWIPFRKIRKRRSTLPKLDIAKAFAALDPVVPSR
jgi:hypothetical protein